VKQELIDLIKSQTSINSVIGNSKGGLWFPVIPTAFTKHEIIDEKFKAGGISRSYNWYW